MNRFTFRRSENRDVGLLCSCHAVSLSSRINSTLTTSLNGVATHYSRQVVRLPTGNTLKRFNRSHGHPSPKHAIKILDLGVGRGFLGSATRLGARGCTAGRDSKVVRWERVVQRFRFEIQCALVLWGASTSRRLYQLLDAYFGRL
jgi:hypothetical protein